MHACNLRVFIEICLGDAGFVGEYTGHGITADEAVFVPGVLMAEFESDRSGSDLGFKAMYTAVGEWCVR